MRKIRFIEAQPDVGVQPQRFQQSHLEPAECLLSAGAELELEVEPMSDVVF